jgi:hypothetical protein
MWLGGRERAAFHRVRGCWRFSDDGATGFSFASAGAAGALPRCRPQSGDEFTDLHFLSSLHFDPQHAASIRRDLRGNFVRLQVRSTSPDRTVSPSFLMPGGR